MSKSTKRNYIIATLVCVVIVFGLTYYYLFSSFSGKDNTEYVYIDNDDTVDSVLTKLTPIATSNGMKVLKLFINNSKYSENIRTGRYAIKPNEGTFKVFRHIKNGIQASEQIVIPSVRTMDKLAGALSKKLMLDSITIYDALTSQAECKKYGYDTTTIAAMFIPNTYDLYWNISIEQLLNRMQKEHKRFWNFERTNKAKQMGLTPIDVATMASIIDEETANDGEKPMIAGMYYNRLKLSNAEYPQGMPLQADPTIKFALKNFGLRRIYNNMLFINSPYNTYKNTGLPPGPIRIPSVAALDAVLNYVHHDYLYMCAKEDFSGTHNFATTYAEHLQNADKYTKALNERGVK